MKKFLATLLLLVLLSGVLATTAALYYSREQTHCFEQLTQYTESMAQKIQQNVQDDQVYLTQVAAKLAQSSLRQPEAIVQDLATLGGNGMLSRLELLLPGDRLLTASGAVLDLQGVLSFQQVAAGGAHISPRMQDPLRPGEFILQIYQPIEQNGQTAAVLCGVVDLATLPWLFPLPADGQEMQFYIIEGQTSNFLMDTWHGSRGSLRELDDLQWKNGYTKERMLADFAALRSGTTVFRSEDAQEDFYSYYRPVGVADWMVAITLPESSVFADAQELLPSFYTIAALLIALFGSYLCWMLREIRQENQASERQLRNVQYMLEVEKALFSAHLQPEQFTVALQKIAAFLSAEWVFFWMAEENAAVLPQRFCCSAADPPPALRNMAEGCPGIQALLQRGETLLTYRIDQLAQQYPADGAALARCGVDSLMALPVTRLNGSMVGVLGACNLHLRWDSLEPLRQVALSFSMTVEHFNVTEALTRMGQVDSLTGLYNRNSYHLALEELKAHPPASLGCVYIDANGLHELNNRLGHQAGDAMLQAVADAIRQTFSTRGYRIGGDEFVVLCPNQPQDALQAQAERMQRQLEQNEVEISIGVGWQQGQPDAALEQAETAMQRNKERYYQQQGGERQQRRLDERMTRMMAEKQQADAALSLLAPAFQGVYAVELSSDRVQQILLPSPFDALLPLEGNRFGQALRRYARENVCAADQAVFDWLCDFTRLPQLLDTQGEQLLSYQKRDGRWVQLRVCKASAYGPNRRETLWIFSYCPAPAASAERQAKPESPQALHPVAQ